MSAKHFFNQSNDLVLSALRSLPLANPSIAFDEEGKVIYHRLAGNSSNGPVQRTSVVCGGGSGHEPAFAGYVGRGLLGAAVAGTVFASPSSNQVERGLRLADRELESSKDRGLVAIVMNYTGDILNFGMAVEKAKAAGLSVEMVVVQDDVGVPRSQGGKVGRRGIAGTSLVVKIAAAYASRGASAKDVHALALSVSRNVVSIGASLDHVHVPGRALPDPKSEDVLGAGEVEIGMGIHNEPGSSRVKTDLPGLVKTLLAQLLDPNDTERAFLSISKSDEVVLLINNLGGLSALELGGIVTEVTSQLHKSWGISPVRILSGAYMTSLNGLGFSISLLKVEPGKGILELLDAPADAAGWLGSSPNLQDNVSEQSAPIKDSLENLGGETVGKSDARLDPSTGIPALRAALEAVIKAEPEITRYDTVVGDGDCGTGMRRGAEAILKLLAGEGNTSDAYVLVSKIARSVETSMDGTSGALYSIFLNALAGNVRQINSGGPMAGKDWGAALQASTASLAKYTPAQPGDRTVIDALQPFVDSLKRNGSIEDAADAAQKGADRTKSMRPSLGRSVYVGGDGWQNVPDPGAHGLAVFFKALAKA